VSGGGSRRWQPLAQIPNTAGYEVQVIGRGGQTYPGVVQRGVDGMHYLELPAGVVYRDLTAWRPAP
jgi:hypothetical protein